MSLTIWKRIFVVFWLSGLFIRKSSSSRSYHTRTNGINRGSESTGQHCVYFGENLCDINLPKLDPNNLSLDIPSEFYSGGLNVINRAAPIVGDVILRTAERMLQLAGGLKPIFGSSLGFRSTKREAVPDDIPAIPEDKEEPEEEEAQESITNIQTEKPSPSPQRRNYYVMSGQRW